MLKQSAEDKKNLVDSTFEGILKTVNKAKDKIDVDKLVKRFSPHLAGKV